MVIFATGSSGTVGRNFPSSVIPLEIDLGSEIQKFEKLLIKEADVVVHAGAIVGPSLVAKDPKGAWEINVEGTRKLGTIALQNGVEKFVYVSSSHVYECGPEYLSETDTVAPLNEYARQKYEGEKTLQKLFAVCPEKLCIIRVFGILDWGMPEFTLGGGLEKLANKDSSFVLKNCDDVRDFLTPKQVAMKIYEISQMRNASGVINLCSGRPTTVGQAAKYMLTRENIEVDSSCMLSGTSTVPRIVGNNSKLKTLFADIALEWEPSSRESLKGDF